MHFFQPKQRPKITKLTITNTNIFSKDTAKLSFSASSQLGHISNVCNASVAQDYPVVICSFNLLATLLQFTD